MLFRSTLQVLYSLWLRNSMFEREGKKRVLLSKWTFVDQCTWSEQRLPFLAFVTIMPSANTIFAKYQPDPSPEDFQFFERPGESDRHSVVQQDPIGWENIRKMFASTENPFYRSSQTELRLFTSNRR
jgi:hypothetical protein